MKRARLRIPSPAMIVALIALVLGMVGTGFAAFKLPKNSVSSKQLKKNSVTGAKIKKNAVTGAKVKDGSLSGKDINLAQLGTVPSAQTANSLAPLEPTHLVGAPGEPGFENGSSNLGSIGPTAVRPVGFYKDHEGIVHLQGFARVGEGGSIGTIFSLPPGYRPANGLVAVFIQFFSPVGGGKCETDSEGDESQNGSVAVTGANVAVGPGVVLSGAMVGRSGRHRDFPRRDQLPGGRLGAVSRCCLIGATTSRGEVVGEKQRRLARRGLFPRRKLGSRE